MKRTNLTKLILIGALSFAHSSCLNEDQAHTKDIATDLDGAGSTNVSYLYYAESTDIVMAECDPNLPPARAACNEIERRDRDDFIARLFADIDAEHGSLIEEIANLTTEIDVIDGNLTDAIIARNDLRVRKRNMDENAAVARGVIDRDLPTLQSEMTDLSVVEEELLSDPLNRDLLTEKAEIEGVMETLQANIDQAVADILLQRDELESITEELDDAEALVDRLRDNLTELQNTKRNKESRLVEVQIDVNIWRSTLRKIDRDGLVYDISSNNSHHESLRKFVKKFKSVMEATN